MTMRTGTVRPPDGYVRTADLISTLSMVTDLSLGLPAEHAARSCFIANEIARELKLPIDQKRDIFYTSLLLDAGCTAWATAFASYVLGDETSARRELYFYRDFNDPREVVDWLKDYMVTDAPLPVRAWRIADFLVNGREFFREGFRNTLEVSHRFADRLGMPLPVQRALMYVFEQWDGKGMPEGIKGEAIPITARIAHVAVFLELAQRRHGRDGAIRLASERRGKAFDPQVVDAFIVVSKRPGFWEQLESETMIDIVQTLEPQGSSQFIHIENLLDIALFIADFADLKSRFALGHSRRVASIAEGIACRMSLPAEEISYIRLAGLFHDLGLVALPSFVLDKPRDTLSASEWETLRLHPYHAERILSRITDLSAVAEMVGAHHERVDGRGYYRELSGTRIPLGARILAVADTFDELTHDGPGRPAMDIEAAVSGMQDEVGSSFDSDVFLAFLEGEEVGARFAPKSLPRRSWPAGLTDREVEVLRLAAKGLTRKQMAEALYVSQSTVRSHLEHIYGKIDVSTRAAATLFAVEHDLVL